MKIIGLKRTPEKATQEAKQYADEILSISDPANMDKLLAESDFVVNITPLTKDTIGMYNSSFFKRMKPTAVFMNIGRGQSVVEADLAEACETGVIAGAYLDVYEKEPLDKESPLWAVENVQMTFHCMDWTADLEETHCGSFNRNLEVYLDGKEFTSVVNKELGY